MLQGGAPTRSLFLSKRPQKSLVAVGVLALLAAAGLTLLDEHGRVGPTSPPGSKAEVTAEVSVADAQVPQERGWGQSEIPPKVLPTELGTIGGPVEVAAGEVLFNVAPGDEAAVVAALRSAGVTWLGQGAATGRWRAAFHPAVPIPQILEQVGQLDGVSGLTPNPVVRGASCEGSLAAYQWEHVAAGSPPDCPDATALRPVTIAILDTGVAYEDRSDATGTYVQATELAGVPFVHPADFVNDDLGAHDDHQHGTHLAGLIASRDRLRGMAPNPVLMPVKVLDEDMAGSEWSLVEGIVWAVDHGAEVINLSLTFSPGYLPSEALLAAVSYAEQEGAVLVAAVGNHGAREVSYPAALPGVIAVAAARPDKDDGSEVKHADYSNEGWAIDVALPGGDLTETKLDHDLGDGLLAQTITPGAPTELGYWMMAGSSQATALASAQAAWALSAGVPPQRVRDALVAGAAKMDGQSDVDRESGRGLSVADGFADYLPADKHGALPEVYVNVVQAIEKPGDDKARLVAWVEVFDSAGQPMPGVEVQGTVRGSVTDELHGKTDHDGRVRLRSDEVDHLQPDEPVLFLFTVDAVQVHRDGEGGDGDGFETRFPAVPGSFYRLSEGTAAQLDAVAAANPGGHLLFTMAPADPEVCALFDCDKLDESYLAQSLGSGFSSSSFNLSFNGAYLRAVAGSGFSSSSFSLSLGGSYLFPWGSADEAELTVVDLAGSGFSSSSFNLLRWNSSLWGSGFSSSSFKMLRYDPLVWGSGFSSSSFNLVQTTSPTLAWGSGFSSSSFNLAMMPLSLPGRGFSSSSFQLNSSWSMWGSGFSSSTFSLSSMELGKLWGSGFSSSSFALAPAKWATITGMSGSSESVAASSEDGVGDGAAGAMPVSLP